jgi:hypothetical protein
MLFVMPSQMRSELSHFPMLKDPYNLQYVAPASSPSKPLSLSALKQSAATGDAHAIQLLLGYAFAILHARTQLLGLYPLLEQVPDSSLPRWVEFTAMATYYEYLATFLQAAEEAYGETAENLSHLQEIHSGAVKWVHVKEMIMESLNLKGTRRNLAVAFPNMQCLVNLLDDMSAFKMIALEREKRRIKAAVPEFEADVPLYVQDDEIVKRRIASALADVPKSLSRPQRIEAVELKLAPSAGHVERDFIAAATEWVLLDAIASATGTQAAKNAAEEAHVMYLTKRSLAKISVPH